jgi:RNase adapter protein RapZ
VKKNSSIITLESYAYRNKPDHTVREWDCRVIANPWHVPGLRNAHGTDPALIQFVKRSKKFPTIFNSAVKAALAIEELKASAPLVFFCVGGRHRSVALVEIIANHLIEHQNFEAG